MNFKSWLLMVPSSGCFCHFNVKLSFWVKTIKNVLWIPSATVVKWFLEAFVNPIMKFCLISKCKSHYQNGSSHSPFLLDHLLFRTILWAFFICPFWSQMFFSVYFLLFPYPKIFSHFFPHTGKNRNRRKSNLLP